jgi:tetratricopeptide (TPR) repeat protein
MNTVMNVLDAVDPKGEVTHLALQAQIALEAGDTANSGRLFQQAAEMLEAAVARLVRPSEKDLACFLAATHYYKGGHYELADRLCGRIRESRLPARVRHLYPPFLEHVTERTAPGYAARYRDRISKAYRRIITRADQSAAQKLIDILIDHPYLLPQDQMAYVRAQCAEVLGLQRAASSFYREAWQFNPENPNYLSCFLDSLGKEGRHEEAWAIVQQELVYHPGVQSSVNAMHVINANLMRSRQSSRVGDQQEVDQQRMNLLEHFESALEAYQSLTPAEQTEIASWVDYAFMIVFVSHVETNNAGQQLVTLNRWIDLRPDSPYPRVLRGMLTYSEDAANTDFLEAIRLGSPDPVPYYFLAHAALRSRSFQECERLCSLALQRGPESDIRAALLSWQAISRWKLGLKTRSEIRKLFSEARKLRPEDPLIASYAQAFEDDGRGPRLSEPLPFESREQMRVQAEKYVQKTSRERLEDMSPTLAPALA